MLKIGLACLAGVGIVLLTGGVARALDHIEISPMIGYTTPGDLEFGVTDVEDVKIEGGMTWGGQIGFYTRQGFGLEASWMQQESKLSAGTLGSFDNLKVGQLHGNFVFERISYGSTVKPYLILGAGATFFDAPGNRDGETKFSWSLGGGIKAAMSDKLALKIQAKYNPTYISDDPGGYWCDPFYGCYYVADPDYLDQGEFSAGLSYTLPTGQ